MIRQAPSRQNGTTRASSGLRAHQPGVKLMYCSVEEIMDAIAAAGARRGADGHGQNALDGRMLALARTDRKDFGMFLVRALRLKMKEKPGDRTRGKKWLTRDETIALFREYGVPEETVEFMTPTDARNQPPDPPETRDLMEAVINAAIRHGSDGHGQDGLMGYMLLLQAKEPKIFRTMTVLAQQWQATTRPDIPKRRTLSEEELRAARADLEAGCRAKYGESWRPQTAEELAYDPYE
jgi:hypothetical protein